MRTLCVLALACVVLIGAGYYFQWFQVATSGGTDTTHVNVTVNKEKIREDVSKVKEQAHKLSQDMSHKVEQSQATTEQ